MKKFYRFFFLFILLLIGILGAFGNNKDAWYEEALHAFRNLDYKN